MRKYWKFILAGIFVISAGQGVAQGEILVSLICLAIAGGLVWWGYKVPVQKKTAPLMTAQETVYYNRGDLVEFFPDELMKIAKVRSEWRLSFAEAKEMDREQIYKYSFIARPAEMVRAGDDVYLECCGVRVGRFKEPEKLKNVELVDAWIGGGPFRLVQDAGFSELTAPYTARLSFERRG